LGYDGIRRLGREVHFMSERPKAPPVGVPLPVGPDAIRSAGVLLPVTALPGPFGIGTLGPDAFDFVDRLRDAGLHWWQMLPLVPPGEGDSPYQSVSAFAGSPLLIDPGALADLGLLTAGEVDAARLVHAGSGDSSYAVDYERVRTVHEPLLRLAASRLSPELRSAVAAFADEQGGWLDDYALFMTLSGVFGGLPFQEWPDEALVRHRRPAVARALQEHGAEVDFWRFVQYEFHREWAALRAHAACNGVGLFGDMPLYVSENSADVWGRSGTFQLGEDLRPARVAGVPPDYYAAAGQRWGQPLYEWERLAADGYAWWIGRVRHALALYDAVRIDHFRGFAAYWSIPADAPDARTGEWVQGPGMAFFRALEKTLGPVPIVAEDLGDIDDAVRALLEATGFPGMKVLQFAFLDGSDSLHLPHNHVRNAIAYTGTHDNDTALGWLHAMGPEERARAIEYCGLPAEGWNRGGADGPGLRALFRTLWASTAVLAVVPMQDLLGFGTDTRMNTPATGSGNWRFRFTRANLEEFTRVSAPVLRDLGRIFRR